MSDRLAPQYRPWRLGASLFSAFGLLALIVSGLGIYGSIAYAVARRTRELGVRIALGASAGAIWKLVAVSGLRPVAIGGVVGIGLSLVGTRLVASLLFGVGTSSVGMIVLALAVLAAAAALAAGIPAWRATSIDPMRVMANE
jgi:ABC-type antimicrobial peptide transport system permease subunit